MATLPQLIEDDIQRIDETLREFLASADATAALVIDKGGFLIAHQGDARDFDLTTIAALSSGAFMANQTIAGLVNETNFNSTYQQGEKFSIFVINVDDNCMLVVIFKSQTGVGVVKYFCRPRRQTHRLPARDRAGTRARGGTRSVRPQRRRRGTILPEERGLISRFHS